MPAPLASETAASQPPPSGAARWFRSRPLQVGTAYFLLHLATHLSAGLFEAGPGGSLWYPPAGLALAYLVLVGPRRAWLVFAANVVGAVLTTRHGLNWSVVAFPLLVTASYTAAAVLVRRLVGPNLLPGTPRQTAVFVGTTVLATAGSAAAGLTLASLLQSAPFAISSQAFMQWWLGDACGVLTVVPVVMVFAGPWIRGEAPTGERCDRSPRCLFFALVRALTLVTSLWLVFSIEALPRTVTFNLCLLPLVWICLRHGLPGATLATLAITMGGLVGMRQVDRSLETSTAFLVLQLSSAAVGLALGSSVSRRNRSETETRQLTQIIEATTDLVFTCDTSGRILHGNAALLRFLGARDLASLRGRELSQLLSAAGWAELGPILAQLRSTGIWTGELQFGGRTGATVPVSAVGILHRSGPGESDPLSFVLHDISERKRREAERLAQERRLLQLQKTESLGVLAGGIAHDFNNLLTAMIGNVELARLDLERGSPLHEPLEQVEFAAQRAADLCRQMLAYAGRRPLAASRVDLNALIGQTQRLFHATLGPKIAVELSLTPASVIVEAEPPQIQQVVLNLVINAAEAIGDREGRIAIRTDHRSFSAEQLRAEFNTDTLPAGRYSFCEVEDSGRGIAPEHLPRIFEPFFSTKQTGHGLGLAAVYGVVTSHRGAIAVRSRPGEGSAFRFVLPLASEAVVAAAPETRRPEWRASGVALVVDDEPSVQLVAAAMLRSFGFETLVAGDGVEAVELFRKHAGKIRLVLLDLIMPRRDGVETLGELQRVAPEIPVVLMSGFVGDIDLARFPDAKPAGRLTKPFSRETLGDCLAPLFGRK